MGNRDIGGRKISAGERITLIWIAANRDERVFEDLDLFRLDRDLSKNLLWGAGIHACPGAPLARLELRVFVEETPVPRRRNRIEARENTNACCLSRRRICHAAAASSAKTFER